jgi:hypothetical protein
MYYGKLNPPSPRLRFVADALITTLYMVRTKIWQMTLFQILILFTNHYGNLKEMMEMASFLKYVDLYLTREWGRFYVGHLYFPSLGNKRRPPPEALTGPRLWRCRQTENAGLGGLFFSLPNTWKSQGAKWQLYGDAEVPKRLRWQAVSFCRQGLEKNLIARHDKCLNRFGDYVEKQTSDAQIYQCAFLSPLTSIRLKNR